MITELTKLTIREIYEAGGIFEAACKYPDAFSKGVRWHITMALGSPECHHCKSRKEHVMYRIALYMNACQRCTEALYYAKNIRPCVFQNKHKTCNCHSSFHKALDSDLCVCGHTEAQHFNPYEENR